MSNGNFNWSKENLEVGDVPVEEIDRVVDEAKHYKEKDDMTYKGGLSINNKYTGGDNNTGEIKEDNKKEKWQQGKPDVDKTAIGAIFVLVVAVVLLLVVVSFFFNNINNVEDENVSTTEVQEEPITIADSFSSSSTEAKEAKKSMEDIEIPQLRNINATQPTLVAKLYLMQLSSAEYEMINMEENLLIERDWMIDLKQIGTIEFNSMATAQFRNNCVEVDLKGYEDTVVLENPVVFQNEECYILIGTTIDRILYWYEFDNTSGWSSVELGNVDLITMPQKYTEIVTVNEDFTVVIMDNSTLAICQEGQVIDSASLYSKAELSDIGIDIEDTDSFKEGVVFSDGYFISTQGILYSVRTGRVNHQPRIWLVYEDVANSQNYVFESDEDEYNMVVYTKKEADDKETKYIIIPKQEEAKFFNLSFNISEVSIEEKSEICEYVGSKMLSSIYFLLEDDGVFHEKWILKVTDAEGNTRSGVYSRILPLSKLKFVVQFMSKEMFDAKVWDAIKYSEYSEVKASVQETIDEYVEQNFQTLLDSDVLTSEEKQEVQDAHEANNETQE